MARLILGAFRFSLPILTSRPSLHRLLSFPRATTAGMHSGTTRDPRRIHILGAGNLGQYLARGLVKQNPKLPVTLLFHRDGLLRDWKAAGEVIECETDGKVDRTGGIDVELVDGKAGSSPISHLIVACKTYMTVPALATVKGRLSKESTIVFLQNGMGAFRNLRVRQPYVIEPFLTRLPRYNRGSYEGSIPGCQIPSYLLGRYLRPRRIQHETIFHHPHWQRPHHPRPRRGKPRIRRLKQRKLFLIR